MNNLYDYETSPIRDNAYITSQLDNRFSQIPDYGGYSGMYGRQYTPPPVVPNTPMRTTGLGGLWDKAKAKYPNTFQGLTQDAGAIGDFASTGAANFGELNFKDQASTLFGVVNGLSGLWNARKQGKLAKEQFNFSKDAFNKNYAASAKTTNAQLADRQAARYARNPKAFATVSDYMKKYGV